MKLRGYNRRNIFCRLVAAMYWRELLEAGIDRMRRMRSVAKPP